MASSLRSASSRIPSSFSSSLLATTAPSSAASRLYFSISPSISTSFRHRCVYLRSAERTPFLGRFRALIGKAEGWSGTGRFCASRRPISAAMAEDLKNLKLEDGEAVENSNGVVAFNKVEQDTGIEAPQKIRSYPFPEIEAQWQQYWEENQTFLTPDVIDTSKPKFYVLDMFPYPSGAGLHVGHPEGYTATDITARYKRMRGFNVLHPMGWDAFGLPAEQYAIEVQRWNESGKFVGVALQTGTHPRVTTLKNIDRFRKQLKALGFSYDWQRELSTTEPDYYKWTQWIFLQLFKRGLAYQAEVAVNWCPALGTVLSNEEVIDGLSERGSHPVIRKPMRQWMLRITEYADRLLEDLDDLDWPESIKDMQRNWIGRSEGAELGFIILDSSGTLRDLSIRVYTTRPDTLCGATYLVMGPEHPLLDQITSTDQKTAPNIRDHVLVIDGPSPVWLTICQCSRGLFTTIGSSIGDTLKKMSVLHRKVMQYVDAALRKSDLERTELQKVKTGVFTGTYAQNPATGEAIPVWVADYVLGSYGTGAIMAVPAHDSRDFEFAVTFQLPMRLVVSPGDGQKWDQEKAFVGDGLIINSSYEIDLNGLSTVEAGAKVTGWLEQKGFGRKQVNYKLRDWLFARQRYWGEPFPLVMLENGEVKAVSESELPVTLPEIDEFTPTGTGEPPLAKATSWVQCMDAESGQSAVRETNTMPQWAGSCWYYLRFMDPKNANALVDPDKERYWGPVDLYVGGAEHSVLHLLYARFWHKVLYDIGVVSSKEPFQCLVNQGMILGEVEYTAFRDTRDGSFVSADLVDGSDFYKDERVPESVVTKMGESYVLKSDASVRVTSRAHKMSKSRGNVVNPDDIVTQYGADSLRLYEMFMGPLRDTKIWSTNGVEGVHRFLGRAWRLVVGMPMPGGTYPNHTIATDTEPTREQLQTLHQCINKVTEEIENLRLNTAISAMMEFINSANKWSDRPKQALEPFVLLLSPLAPHIAEELWQRLGHSKSLAYEPWPEAIDEYLREDSVTLPVQFNGKTRGTVQVAVGADQTAAFAAVQNDTNFSKFLDGKDIRKTIYVPGRILNLIVK